MSNNVDVIIHTRNSMTEEQFDAIADQVRELEGIVKFERNQRLPNTIMVVYDAGETRALEILDKVIHEGVSASLVAA